MRLLADWALGELGLGRLQVFVAPQNVAALRLVSRTGFRREGVLRAYWSAGAGRVDAVVLSRLPTDVP
jgi:RimJ/RimL family protein N-acetyltransferase